MGDWTIGGWAWFALALVNAGLAEQKNRSRLSWFFVSLVLGPLATAAIVICAPADAVEPQPFRPFADRNDRISLFTVLALFVALLFALSAGIARQPWLLVGTAGAIGLSVWLFAVGRKSVPASSERGES